MNEWDAMMMIHEWELRKWDAEVYISHQNEIRDSFSSAEKVKILLLDRKIWFFSGVGDKILSEEVSGMQIAIIYFLASIGLRKKNICAERKR